MIVYLVDAGADINSREKNGLTILGNAENRESEKSYDVIVDVLKKLGAAK